MPVEAPAAGGVAVSVLDIASRIFCALVFGTLVGIERQWHHKNAGVRTHALVAIGACTFSLISLLGFGPTSNPMLIAAGVVTGIGFLGAGVILRQGGMVQGINTAATLWATASMGLALGAGYAIVAALTFGAVLSVQFPLRWLEEAIESRSPRRREPPPPASQ